MGLEIGNKVSVEYTGTLDDGTTFDSTEAHGEPMVFTFGTDRLIKGFEDALTDMELNQEKEFRIETAEAYGDVNPDMIQIIPKTNVADQEEGIEIGMMITMELPDGQHIPATIVPEQAPI